MKERQDGVKEHPPQVTIGNMLSTFFSYLRADGPSVWPNQHEISIGTAYAVWTGIGAAYSYVFDRDPKRGMLSERFPFNNRVASSKPKGTP